MTNFLGDMKWIWKIFDQYCGDLKNRSTREWESRVHEKFPYIEIRKRYETRNLTGYPSSRRTPKLYLNYYLLYSGNKS